MIEPKHSAGELEQMQALPLDVKIKMTERRIEEWHDAHDGSVYVSFSGGKDSTVLLHIARGIFPDIKAVFIDTGLEFPEIRRFVGTFDNVDVVKPEKPFARIVKDYGYPVFGKETCKAIRYARRYKSMMENGIPNEKGLYESAWRKVNGYEPFGRESIYTRMNYKFMLDAPFEVSEECCSVLKKAAVHKYERRTGLHPITAQMADESLLRRLQWMRNGCNAFDGAHPISNPMAFWKQADVLEYARQRGIKFCDIYGDIVGEGNGIHTTGCNRTGCFACGFGIQRESPEKSRIKAIASYSNSNLVNWMLRGGVLRRGGRLVEAEGWPRTCVCV